MDQPATALAAAKPHWIADAVVGVTGALAVITVAHAALPMTGKEALVGPRAEAVALRGPVSEPVVAPAFSYIDPVAGYEVISPFGLRKLPWEERGRLHAGVDVAAPSGYPIQATADGVVTRAGVGGGYGRFVEVRHAEGLTSLYAHMGKIADHIAPGQPVRAGEFIGRVGNTGSSTGAHLHFEIHDAKGRPLNPQMFLGRQFATAEDLPLKEAARVPRRMRLAYVSYIPRKKRELMEAREQARQTTLAVREVGNAAPAMQVRTYPSGQTVTLTRGPVTAASAPSKTIGGIKPAPLAVPAPTTAQAAPAKSRAQWISVAPSDDDAPIVTRRDLFGVGEDLPGWSSSGG